MFDILTQNKIRPIARRKVHSVLATHYTNHNVLLFNRIYTCIIIKYTYYIYIDTKDLTYNLKKHMIQNFIQS